MARNDVKPDEYIAKGISRTYEGLRQALPQKSKRSDGYFDQFKLKLKKKKMPTALRAVYYKEKFAQFFGNNDAQAPSGDSESIGFAAPRSAPMSAVADGPATIDKLTATGSDSKSDGNGVHAAAPVSVGASGARWLAYAAPDGGDDEALGDHVGDAYSGAPMSSGLVSASISGSSAGPGGFGLGDFGMVAFGEAVNRNMRAARAFIQSTGLAADAARVVEDGYRYIFQSVIEGETAVLMGLQPSMADYIRFELDVLVHALNAYSGPIVSVVLSERSGMESMDDIRMWYLHIGIKPEVVSDIIFVEKANEAVSETMIDLSFVDVDNGEYVLDSWSSIGGFVREIQGPKLIGCADTYMMGEFMAAMAEMHIKFEIDKRFIFVL